MKVETDRLSKLPSTPSNKNLLLASQALCYTSYERFKSNINRIDDYKVIRLMSTECDQNDHHTNNEVLCYEVQSVRYPDAPPRRLTKGDSFRCNCEDRKRDLEMCVHEIIALGFQKSFFEP